jgi:hypothetical protein
VAGLNAGNLVFHWTVIFPPRLSQTAENRQEALAVWKRGPVEVLVVDRIEEPAEYWKRKLKGPRGAKLLSLTERFRYRGVSRHRKWIGLPFSSWVSPYNSLPL